MFYLPNDVRGIVNMVTDTGETFFGAGGTISFPQISAIAATAYGAGGTVTYTANTEGTTTVTPTVIYTAVALYEDALNTSIKDLPTVYAPVLAEGLFQNMEEAITALHASTITTVGSSNTGYNFLEADFFNGLEQLHANAKDKAVPGQIYAIYHPLQYGNMMQVPTFASAAYRGETNGPAKTGVIGQAGGAKLFFTTNVNTQTAAINNLLIVPSWCILARKNRPKVELERSQLALRMIASTQFGVKVQSTLLGVRHITQSV